MDLTDRLIDHDAWLTRRLLERAATLSDEQLDAPLAVPQHPLPFESTEGTLREAQREVCRGLLGEKHSGKTPYELLSIEQQECRKGRLNHR